jgi:hypothetical protein
MCDFINLNVYELTKEACEYRDLTYHLQLSDVLLPPEVLLVLWPRVGGEVVRIHDDVNKGVDGTDECPVASWN